MFIRAKRFPDFYTSFIALAVAAVFSLSLSAEPAFAENGGVLWKQRAAEIAEHEPPKERSLVPVIISAMAGGVLGIEVAVVGIGVAAGATTNWWILGGAGAAIGAISGYYAGDYFFNPRIDDTQLKKAEMRTAQKDRANSK